MGSRDADAEAVPSNRLSVFLSFCVFLFLFLCTPDSGVAGDEAMSAQSGTVMSVR